MVKKRTGKPNRELRRKPPCEPWMVAFSSLWERLFATTAHLDSSLSKQPRELKSELAEIIHPLLSTPVSLAQALKVVIGSGEPWSVPLSARGSWRAARRIAERLKEEREKRGVPFLVKGSEQDFPAEMLREWKSSFGTESVPKLAALLTSQPPLSLRAVRRLGQEALFQRLKEEALAQTSVEWPEITPSEIAPMGVRLSSYAPVLKTALFQEGVFEIQDEGSQIMALFSLWPERFGALLKPFPGPVQVEAERRDALADFIPPPGFTVVDACAGAGGKTLAIADALKGRGRVFAYDTAEVKLQALRRRASRAGYRNIQTVTVADGKEEEVVARFPESAQVVLVDAPCSGWGVLRRIPDIKWRQSPEELERMPRLQARLLSAYSGLVAPGGRLVYGVCTFRLPETVDVARKFVETHPEFELEQGGFLGPGPCDGFFMQSFKKKREGTRS